MDSFDANSLIYAAGQHARGAGALKVISAGVPGEHIGSILLVVEVLAHTIRHGNVGERLQLEWILGQLDLKPVDDDVAYLATELCAKYGLKTVDGVHLATAIWWGASRFHTNNSKDFGSHIEEIEIVLP